MFPIKKDEQKSKTKLTPKRKTNKAQIPYNLEQIRMTTNPCSELYYSNFCLQELKNDSTNVILKITWQLMQLFNHYNRYNWHKFWHVKER